MNADRGWARGRGRAGLLSRVVLAMALAALLCGFMNIPGTQRAFAQDATPAAGATPVPRQERPALAAGETLDLAAMALTPDDLAALGLAGYGLDFGRTSWPDEDYVSDIADASGRSPEEVREIFAAANFRRWYEVDIDLPSDDPAQVARRVRVYLWELGNPAGAAVFHELMEDESGDPTAEDLAGTRTIGDSSEITRWGDIDSDVSDALVELDLGFRVGGVVAAVSVSEFEADPDEEPTIAEVEALAGRLRERIASVVAEGAPGLSTRVVRFEAFDDGPVNFGLDFYSQVDGVALPVYANLPGEPPPAPMIDAYTYQVPVAYAGAAEYVVGSYVNRFAGDEEASAWLRATALQFAAIAGVTVEDVTMLGDEAIRFEQADEGDGGEYQIVSVLVRVGADVGQVLIVGTERPPADAATELAQAQVRCLQDGCPGSQAVPVALTERGSVR
jgi:hypothetical protein